MPHNSLFSAHHLIMRSLKRNVTKHFNAARARGEKISLHSFMSSHEEALTRLYEESEKTLIEFKQECIDEYTKVTGDKKKWKQETRAQKKRKLTTSGKIFGVLRGAHGNTNDFYVPIEVKKTKTIGRFKENDLVIEHNLISRVHCMITIFKGAAYITDSSTNGTFVNGVLLKKNIGVRLPSGSIVSFGHGQLSFMFIEKGGRIPDRGEEIQTVQKAIDASVVKYPKRGSDLQNLEELRDTRRPEGSSIISGDRAIVFMVPLHMTIDQAILKHHIQKNKVLKNLDKIQKSL